MRENKLVIAASRVSLSYRLAKNKAILPRKGQRKFLVWGRRRRKKKKIKEGNKNTKKLSEVSKCVG